MNLRFTRSMALAAIVIVIILIGAFVMTPLFDRVISRARSYIPTPLYKEPIPSAGDYANVIFLHHSTGGNLIKQGGVRQALTERGYQFWDHGYNHHGLVRPDGTKVNASYRIPGNGSRGNTDVDGLVRIFSQPVTDPPSNAFSRLLQHEVIAFKSCFPNSAIKSAEMEQQSKRWYLEIRDAIDEHPDRVFILVTSPPLHPLATKPDEARRARAISDWLASDQFLQGRPNLFVFDFFDLLADPEANMLRTKYQLDPTDSDSHPNRLANQTIGPIFATFVDQAVQTYKNDGADTP